MVLAWTETCRSKCHSFKRFNISTILYVCISWNNKKYLIPLTHGTIIKIWLSKFIESIRQTFHIDSCRFPKEYAWIYANVLRLTIICSHLRAGYLQIHTETNHVADILKLQFTAHVMLLHMLNLSYFSTSTFLSICTVPNVVVFCSSLISSFPGMLLRFSS